MWEISLSQQVETVILSFLAGGFFGFVFDTFKAFRSFFSLKSLGVFMCDILFFILISPMEFCFFVSRCNGEIRGFVLAVQLIGFIVCRVTLSKIYLKLLLFLFFTLNKVIRLLNNQVCKISSFARECFKKMTKKLKISQKNWAFLRKKG